MDDSLVPRLEMFAIFLGAAIALQTQDQPPAIAPIPAPPPFEVKNPTRIALTPTLDGKIDPEEWESLAQIGPVETYFQWEPGILYLAGRAPVGKELVWSIDLDGDGWLVGKDNLEIRVSSAGTVKTVTRMDDATDRNGPRWIDSNLYPESLEIAGLEDPSGWTFEAKLLGVGIGDISESKRIGVRVDVVNAGESTPDAFLPRATCVVTLNLDTASGLPANLSWFPDYKVRTVVPGEGFPLKLRFKNEGKARFSRIEIRGEGAAKDATSSTGKPFPEFDLKGRAAVDYDTNIAGSASQGYRVLRATLIDSGNDSAVLRTSYRITDPVLFDVNLQQISSKPDSQIVRGSVTLRSQSTKKLNGRFTLELPSGWAISSGNDRKFTIYHARGSWRNKLELISPQNARGLVPMKFRAEIGGKLVQSTYWYLIK